MHFRVKAIASRAAAVGARATPLLAALLLVSPVSTIQAASPLGVHIVIETTVGDVGHGPFVATGPAVDDGLVCGEGDTVDIGLKVVFTPRGANIQDLKQYTCSDGSGAFMLQAAGRHDDARGYATGSWIVDSGTGAYATLRGSGTSYVVPLFDGASGELIGFHEELWGTVH